MINLENKVVVITGGNSGIGLETARVFRKKGARVITNARNAQRLKETEAEYGEIFDKVLVADLTKTEETSKFFDEVGKAYGRIDTLFLNAGVAYLAPIDQITDELYDAQFNLNVKSLLFSVKAALPYLTKGSSILINTSINGRIAMPGSTIYAATKAAARSISLVLAGELVDRGIRVNAIAPGPIETPIFSKMGMPEETLKETAASIQARVPVGRFGKPHEVASLALELSTNDYITGQEFVVDGGMSAL
ncbi:SDR family oxidoreductase [Roseivirga sp. BDSF3-8]|uniref:SDR family oxidoreductase n=1 Tax=Roseivirga sp. BDSF3-8 TaxID=3241598 RepID=UPI003532005B